MGFLGDCGYNQLLYPVEVQTREILTWIVEKLPRTEEEGAEEVLGANALLNKRITQSLMDWRKKLWKLPFSATGVPPQNVYASRSFRTPQNTLDPKKRTFDLFRECATYKMTVDSSIFERNSFGLVQDSMYETTNLDEFEEDGEGTASSASGITGSLKNNLRNAISNAAQKSKISTDAAASGGAPTSLQDLIAGITDTFNASGAGAASATKDNRGTRFSHAMEFAQESSAAVGEEGADGSGSGGSTAVGGRKGGGGSSSNAAAALAAAAADLTLQDATSRKARQEEEERRRQQELDELRAEVQVEAESLDAVTRQQGLHAAKVRQFESELSKLHTETDGLEKEIIVKKKTLEMLPSAADNISKLQSICSASSARLMQLAQEWESHRRPLVEQLRDKKGSKARRRARCRGMVDEMKKYREEMASMIQDLKDKQDRSQVLAEEMTKLPKNINRAIYTHRIMDITASIVKQQGSIDKITQDIRDIQKTINLNTNTLTRSDAVAEELIFSAANDKNDPTMVDTYRRLKTLRQRFDDLISVVNKIGNQEKTERDLETKIDQERARISSNNFDRIQTDLEAISKENAQLVSQIKKAQKK